MAFDAEPGGDPRGPMCPKCGKPVIEGQPFTIMHFHEDPHGHRGLGGRRWHSECARPHWDTLTRVLDQLNRRWGA